MTDILLIIGFLIIGVFGFFVMGSLDKFLTKNRKAITKEAKEKRKRNMQSDETDEDVQKEENPAEKEVNISGKTNNK